MIEAGDKQEEILKVLESDDPISSDQKTEQVFFKWPQTLFSEIESV